MWLSHFSRGKYKMHFADKNPSPKRIFQLAPWRRVIGWIWIPRNYVRSVKLVEPCWDLEFNLRGYNDAFQCPCGPWCEFSMWARTFYGLPTGYRSVVEISPNLEAMDSRFVYVRSLSRGCGRKVLRIACIHRKVSPDNIGILVSTGFSVFGNSCIGYRLSVPTRWPKKSPTR